MLELLGSNLTAASTNPITPSRLPTNILVEGHRNALVRAVREHQAFDFAGSLRPQTTKASISGSSAMPVAVKAYSTLGGTCG